jgi:hypothetical protein
MNSYDDACRRAAEDQHLGAFYDAPGWTVEQTGGFTMVAVRYMGDGHCYTVTYDGDGYMGCRQTVKGWQEGAEPADDAYMSGLTLTDALALGSSVRADYPGWSVALDAFKAATAELLAAWESDDVPGDALGTTYGLPLAFEEVAHVVAGWEAQR